MSHSDNKARAFERKQRMRALSGDDFAIDKALDQIQALIAAENKAEAAARFYEVFCVMRAYCRMNRFIFALLLLLAAVSLAAVLREPRAPLAENYFWFFLMSLYVAFGRFYIGNKYVRLASRHSTIGLHRPKFWRQVYEIGAALQMPAIQKALIPKDIFALCEHLQSHYERALRAEGSRILAECESRLRAQLPASEWFKYKYSDLS